MSTEDDLRAAMRAHEHEAPTELDWAPPVVRRRLVLPLLAAAAVVLLVAGTLAVFGRDRGESRQRAAAPAPIAAPACPAKYRSTTSMDGWVPARSRVSGTERQLVPNRTPDSAVACGYEAGSSSHRALSDLRTIPVTLSSAPPDGTRSPCAAYFSQHDNDNYLLGLRYGTQVLWVAAPANHCAGSSNGRFVSRANLSGSAMSALRSGHWPTTRRVGCETSVGRAGDRTSLVPAGAIAVDVCVRDKRSRTLTGQRAHELATLLGAATTPSDRSRACLLQTPGLRVTVLQFRYRDGPSVTVSFAEGCALRATNGQTGRTLSMTQYREIVRLLS